jgi:hypothetical protein
MMRSIAAVAVGLLVSMALMFLFHLAAVLVTGVPVEATSSTPYLVANVIAGHLFVLALAILLISLPTLLGDGVPGQPTWYPALMSVVGPVAVLIGGILAARRWRGRSSGGARAAG